MVYCEQVNCSLEQVRGQFNSSSALRQSTLLSQILFSSKQIPAPVPKGQIIPLQNWIGDDFGNCPVSIQTCTNRYLIKINEIMQFVECSDSPIVL